MISSSIIYKTMFVSLIAIAVFFSTFRLSESPPVWYDEGWYIQSAMNLIDTGETGLRLSPTEVAHVSAQTTVGYPLIYPLAGWMSLFGRDVLAARSLMVLFILGFVLAAAYLARRLWGSQIALAVLALVATLPTLYGNGKSVLGEVPGLLYFAVFLIMFHLATQASAHKRAWLVGSAIFAGFCVVTKPVFLLLLPAILVAIVIEVRRGSIKAGDVALSAAAGLIPIALWAFLQFRNSDSIQAVLSYYANPYEIKDLGQVILSNAKRLFTDIGTLYLSATMILWTAALSIRLKTRERIQSVEIVAFILSALVALAYLRTAGWYRYLFPAQAVALIFVPASLRCLADRYPKAFMRRAVYALVAVLALLGSYQLAFKSWVADAYSSHKTQEWQDYMKTVRPDDTIFFYDVPEAALFAPTLNYYQYLAPAGIILGEKNLDVLRAAIPARVIIESDAYASRRSLFSGYAREREIGKYSILKPSP